MLSRFKRPLVGLALALTLGLHWPVLQSVAWMSMLVSYSKESGIEQAWGKTFDGKHPCKLCKLVSEGKKTEKKQNQAKSPKLDLACLFAHAPFIYQTLHLDSTSFERLARTRPCPPLKLPPDLA